MQHYKENGRVYKVKLIIGWQRPEIGSLDHIQVGIKAFTPKSKMHQNPRLEYIMREQMMVMMVMRMMIRMMVVMRMMMVMMSSTSNFCTFIQIYSCITLPKSNFLHKCLFVHKCCYTFIINFMTSALWSQYNNIL